MHRAWWLLGLLASAPAVAADFGLGVAAAAERIGAWDIAVGPAGVELPAGQGSVAEGAALFAARCAACHGASGREGPDPVLVGGRGSLASAQPLRTVGSYWPYATTVFDYVRRAMPFTAPGSLSNDQVYAVTAWLLAANGIVGDDAVLDRDTLPRVEMPNRDGFVPDPRPDVP